MGKDKTITVPVTIITDDGPKTVKAAAIVTTKENEVAKAAATFRAGVRAVGRRRKGFLVK